MRRPDQLTPRELMVVSLVSRGWLNHEIGSMLGVRTSTVTTLLGRAYDRLGARNRVHALELMGWLRPPTSDAIQAIEADMLTKEAEHEVPAQ